jgi:hypothetical protein
MPPTHTDEGLRAAIAARSTVPEMAIPRALAVRRGALRQRLLAAGGAGIGYLLKERVADVGEFRRVGSAGRGRRDGVRPEVVAQLMGRRRKD